MIYIFDLDGTLADIEHRLHWISSGERNYGMFYSLCVNDKPIKDTIETLQHLAISSNSIYIVTGRSDEVRQQTNDWLKRAGVIYQQLIMRKEGDHRPDYEIKEEWLLKHFPTKEDRSQIAGVFEDRKSVVDMWRRNGLMCYQCAEGDF